VRTCERAAKYQQDVFSIRVFRGALIEGAHIVKVTPE
jgi:hypothetical protein